MSRRQARELALQVLYQIDVGRAEPEFALEQAFSREREPELDRKLSAADKEFAADLVRGTWSHREQFDELISRHARDWTIDRMPAVDRNILRMAIYEINCRHDVSPSVAVDEAVELAKAYSTADSGRFVNGVLGSVIREAQQGAPE